MKILKAADLFCGAGGTSSGVVRACSLLSMGVELTAINHWDVAIATHSANHPSARHLCTGLDAVNPRDLYNRGELGLLWASPECTHHSVARGGRPINEQSRATAHCVTRWAEVLAPDIVLIENVPEFVTWGPLDCKHRPLKRRAGELFHAWINMFRAAGYRVEWRKLVAADYGDPTTRERLIIYMVRGKRRIVWPEPTHAPREEHPGSPELFLYSRRPWRAAREIIDWQLKGTLLTDRKKALADKTMDRILAGFFKQCEEKGIKVGPGGTGEAFIIPNFGERNGQTPRSHDIDDPLPAVTSHGAGCLVEPFIVGAGGPGYAAKPQSVDEPLNTVTTENHRALVEPFILPHAGRNMHWNNAARSVDEPIPTVTASHGAGALVEPYIVTVANGGEDKYRTRSIDEPLPTVTAGAVRCGVAVPELEPMIIPQNSSNAARSVNEPAPVVTTTSRGIGLAEPFLVRYQGDHAGREDGKHRTQSVDAPLPTVTTENRFGVAEPEAYLIEMRGTSPAQIAQSGKSLEKPLGTVTAGGIHAALIEPMVVSIDHTGGNGSCCRVDSEPLTTVGTKQRHAVVEPEAFLVQVAHGNGKDGKKGNKRRSRKVSEPLPTVTGNRGEWSLVEPCVLPQQSGGAMRPVSQPLPTVATDGAIALVEPYVIEYYGTGGAQSVDKPLSTVTTKHRHALVLPVITLGDGRKLVVNFRFRMLQPHELAGAQADRQRRARRARHRRDSRGSHSAIRH